MRKFIYLFFILTQTNVFVFSQTQNEKIDNLVQAYTNLNKFSGNVLIAEKGKIIFEKSYGFADREFDVPNSKNSKFRIASLTKQFTAVLIMQLVESGKIELNATITQYLPYYKKEIGDRITIHQLLTHTSGLAEYTERDDFFSDISKHSYTHKEFVQKFCSDSLLSKPGTQYKYSNTGYYILGTIIEEITKNNYADVLQKNILDVAGMKNTGVENSSTIIKQLAKGYNFKSGIYLNADYIDILSTIFSAGAIYSTTGDLFLWDKAFYTDQLLTQKSRELMFTATLANYGYGVGITKFFVTDLNKEMHFIFHQGAINGFRSIMTHIVNENVLIAMLCNNFDTDLNPISNGIFSILHNQQYTIPNE
ncbi:serine hydrolase domain-containing protein [Niabella sp. CJ426]|uniref:serine hydrolase domain-containing protein n=1 Tax=Niabella sp. CJ426 TaxID=3393740 RepID=UPI003D002AB6